MSKAWNSKRVFSKCSGLQTKREGDKACLKHQQIEKTGSIGSSTKTFVEKNQEKNQLQHFTGKN